MKKLLAIMILGGFGFSRFVFAQTGGGRGGDAASIDNPLAADSIEELFLKILDVLLIFAVPIIVFFIMYAGFLYVTARGDETKVKKAHAALTWSIIGGVIVLGAKVILEVIQGTISNF